MPSPPFFAGIPDDTMLPTKQNQNQQKQQKQWKRKAPPPPLPLPSPPAAVVKKIEKQVEEEDQEQQQQELQEPPPPDQFAQHFEAIVKTAREARARLHDKLNEVLQEGRYVLKTAIKEMEGTVKASKELVDKQIGLSLQEAQREARLAREAARKAEALAQRLAFIRGRAEGSGGGGGGGGESD